MRVRISVYHDARRFFRRAEIVAPNANSHARIAAVLTAISAFFSGSLDPFWPHFVLLGCAIIGGIAVGIGIVMESERWSLATVLVVIGVATEAIFTILLFLFDEGISSSQQSKIFDLESRIAPRHLSADELTVLEAAVKPFTDRQISIWSYGVDLEAGMLAVQIKSALEAARVPTVDSIGHMVTSWTPRVGVIVTGPDDKLVEALLTALKPVSAVRGSLGSTKPSNVVPAEIFVGVKPLSP
jgi:hypothetical protein